MQEPKVTYATVRGGDTEVHVECRFSDGQKRAAVVIDTDQDDAAGNSIARQIAETLSSDIKVLEVPVPERKTVDGWDEYVIDHVAADGQAIRVIVDYEFPELARRVAGALAVAPANEPTAPTPFG